MDCGDPESCSLSPVLNVFPFICVSFDFFFHHQLTVFSRNKSFSSSIKFIPKCSELYCLVVNKIVSISALNSSLVVYRNIVGFLC